MGPFANADGGVAIALGMTLVSAMAIQNAVPPVVAFLTRITVKAAA
jgi:hypothetical protein